MDSAVKAFLQHVIIRLEHIRLIQWARIKYGALRTQIENFQNTQNIFWCTLLWAIAYMFNDIWMTANYKFTGVYVRHKIPKS